MSRVLTPKSSLSFGSNNLFFDQPLGSMQLHVNDLAPLLHAIAVSADESDVSKHANSDEEVVEITNFLVEREAGTATPKEQRNRFSTSAFPGGDIRAHMTPKSKPRVVSDHKTTSADDPVSSSEASCPASRTASSSLPNSINLTLDSRVHVNVKRPVGRPRKPTAGPSENDTRPKRPVGRPRKLPQETWLKGPLNPLSSSLPDSAPRRRGRPRKTPIPSQIAPQISIDIPVKQSDEHPRKHIISATQSATVGDNSSSSPISYASPAVSLSSESQAGYMPMRPNDSGLVSALSSAFFQNAAQNSGHERQQDQSLVGALASAFANNINPNDTDDESIESLFDPNSDSMPEPPKHRRHRISMKRVPQIPPSPVKHLRPKRTSTATSVVPSEEAVDGHSNVEYLPVDLPLGVSIAPENESEYVDPNDEVLLDYDSSSDIVEERRRQEELKSTLSTLTLRNNLRFLLKEAPSRSASRPAPMQYTALATPSTTTYAQLVEEHCGNHALWSILNDQPSWEVNLKPRNYLRRRAPIDSLLYESSISELLSGGEETGNAIKVTKRSHSEDDPAPRKKVKFSDTMSVSSFQSSTAHAGNPSSSRSGSDVGFWGELLQKLVKGKVPMSRQEHEIVLSFFGDPAIQRIIRESQVGDGDELDLLSADNLQVCNSIWQALQHISQSPPGALGIPDLIESTLRWETQKMIRFVAAQ